ncbi:Pnap_2097 family protein [Polaromonas glacialis]|uniref:Pnap_2097 family protein n=1 Tax=Polaromonas glacialis TaxID=866564 RepID=UPI00068A6469|nr:Pnap_2097 family protein [Polaromonas glacialis]
MTRVVVRQACLEALYVAGMPNLCYNGLSENWLLKECGHRHWLAMAQALGRQQPEFRNAQGRKVYAAFTLVRLSDAKLEQIGEHDAFFIISQCLPACRSVGRAQHYSRHDLRVHGRRGARVEMLSAFVRREKPGNNLSVVRAAMTESKVNHDAMDQELATAADAFVRHGRERRAGVWSGPPGMDLEEGGTDRYETVFMPCPNNDFNGADLLYFASFQAVVDRAEWSWMVNALPPGQPASIIEREMVFYSNMNLGDSVRTSLGVHDSGGMHLSHRSELRRGSDNARIAEVYTRKLIPLYAQGKALTIPTDMVFLKATASYASD